MLIIALMVLPAFNLPHANAQAKPTQPKFMGFSRILCPQPEADLGVAVVNGKIYAIGGFDGNSPLSVNEEYTPALKRLDHHVVDADGQKRLRSCSLQRQDLLHRRNHRAIGGNNEYVGNNEVYDPATDTWQTEASMPTPRADLSASVVNGKIYLVGGMEYSSKSPFYVETNVTEVYDPSTNIWSTAASMPLLFTATLQQ